MMNNSFVTKTQLDFYYKRLFQQFFSKKYINGGKKWFIIKLVILSIIFCIFVEGTILSLIPIKYYSTLILETILIYLSSLGITLLIFSGMIFNYRYVKKEFSNMILACQIDNEKRLLAIELTKFEAKANSRTRVDDNEKLLYEFFKAKYLLSNNQIEESLKIFELLMRKINKKFHLVYEIYFQIGKIYLKLGDQEKALSFVESAYNGFAKFNYDEPIREIDELHILKH